MRQLLKVNFRFLNHKYLFLSLFRFIFCWGLAFRAAPMYLVHSFLSCHSCGAKPLTVGTLGVGFRATLQPAVGNLLFAVLCYCKKVCSGSGTISGSQSEDRGSTRPWCRDLTLMLSDAYDWDTCASPCRDRIICLWQRCAMSHSPGPQFPKSIVCVLVRIGKQRYHCITCSMPVELLGLHCTQ